MGARNFRKVGKFFDKGKATFIFELSGRGEAKARLKKNIEKACMQV